VKRVKKKKSGLHEQPVLGPAADGTNQFIPAQSVNSLRICVHASEPHGYADADGLRTLAPWTAVFGESFGDEEVFGEPFGDGGVERIRWRQRLFS
jgi:hypothetical protein